MLAAVYSFSVRGANLSKQISTYLASIGYTVRNRTVAKYAEQVGLEAMLPNHNVVCAADFIDCQTIIFVGATGIAVRTIAPYIKSKLTDPAVIAVDECANFVIPLLAGHIGGANELARCLALAIEAVPCVTTATDVNGLFAVDEWAARNHMVLCSLKEAKDFSAALVNNETVGVYFDQDIKLKGTLPSLMQIDTTLSIGMAVTLNKNLKPFKTTVSLLPKILHLGIGCRRNTPLEKIEALVLLELERLQFDIRCVAKVASVDLKKDELGLLSFAQKYDLPISFYTADELNSLVGDFTPSAFVKSVVGVSNVCERSAVFSSKNGKILLRKTSKDGVTLSIAMENLEIDFHNIGLKLDKEK